MERSHRQGPGPSGTFGRQEKEIYANWLKILEDAKISYAVGGAYALGFYTGIWRNTKDLDVFLTPGDLSDMLITMQEAGFWTTVSNPTWLAKVRSDHHFMDLIFGLSNNANKVDRSWIENAVSAEIFGIPSRVLSPEELLTSKCYVLRRDRFDGADIAHLIRGLKGELNWDRVLDLLGADRQLLLWHLLLFDYVYPGHSEYLPRDLMDRLFAEARNRWISGTVSPNIFFGLRVDPEQFQVDVTQFDYQGEGFYPLVDEKGKAL